MAFYQNLKEHCHQNQNSTSTPVMSLGYLWESRRGGLECVFLAKPEILLDKLWLHSLIIFAY